MDKSAIKNFAIEARKILMKSAETESGFYGVTKNGCKKPIQKGDDFEVYETIAGTENRIYGGDIKRRANLVKAVETLGFEQVIEETAYTWFNRIIAIRFMEVNDYLPTRVRVLSSETGSNTPDIVTQSLDVDLNMTPEELEKVQKAKDENRYDDAFRMLFIKQCNELNAILPGIFEKTDDYMELLLKLSYTSDGVVRMLVDSIDENNFNVETEGQVEIIGWMYQYYNTELKDDTFAKLKKNVKISKDRIPAATQLFTPDWIVCYMVENSVGRVWIEHLRALDSSVDEKAKAEEFGWKYYLPEAEQEEEVNQKLIEIRKDYLSLEPKDISCIDPCMGSGHILVYMFDVLMDIYRSEGFSERDAAFSILENNIHGLDIDKRAYQLSYFALMMKARGYNRTFFRGKQDKNGERKLVQPVVLSIEEGNDINIEHIKYLGCDLNEEDKKLAYLQLRELINSFRDAKEFGVMIAIHEYDWNLLRNYVNAYDSEGQIDFETYGIEITQKRLLGLIEQGIIFSSKYWVVATNPPYLGNKSMSEKISIFLKTQFNDYKMDVFSVIVKNCIDMCKEYGKLGFMTPFVWMFISSFYGLREYAIDNTRFTSLVQLEYSGFDGATVPICTYTLAKDNLDIPGEFIKLSDFKGADAQPVKTLEAVKNKDCGYRYSVKTSIFKLFPESVIAFWASNAFIQLFQKYKSLESYFPCKKGMTTGKNELFLRIWYEIDQRKLGGRYKFYCKGGGYRKWYGNEECVIDWIDNGRRLREFKGATLRNEVYYFKKAMSWGLITSNLFSCRAVLDDNHVIGDAGPICITDEKSYLYTLGFLNSIVATYIMDFLNPTMNFSSGVVGSLPYIQYEQIEPSIVNRINELVNENIAISKENWDMRETSWEFKSHVLLANRLNQTGLISERYMTLKEVLDSNFDKLKKNEEELNEIFISIYGLGNELSPMINSKEISLDIPDEKEIIETLISYAVGCMLGRYALNKEGIVLAGENIDLNSYGVFYPDVDGIIPINDEAYFKDDIVEQFIEWLKCAFGEETLEDNMNYIAQVLSPKGMNAKETVRAYFLSDFIKNHASMYSVTGTGKRPIYWLFDSGKHNGFKCLIYMHRYNKDTLNLIRSEYLHKTEDAVENALKNAEYIIQTSSSAVERAKATKNRDKYVKQLNEMRIYYQALSHLALQKIEIDLDDGVKHNYQLFQGVEVIADGGKKQKVDLLAKI